MEKCEGSGCQEMKGEEKEEGREERGAKPIYIYDMCMLLILMLNTGLLKFCINIVH
jgi:hypothetical protein